MTMPTPMAIIALYVHVLMVSFSTNNFVTEKVTQFEEPDKIRIHDYEFSDESPNFEAISLPLDPDFLLFVTTESTQGHPRNLYRYDQSNKITLLERINADEIEILQKELFFLSYSDRKYFFMDKNLQKINIKQIGDQLKYKPSPFNPRYIASYDDSIHPYHIFLNDDNSKTRIGSVSDAHKFQWISQDGVDAVVVQTSRSVKVLKMVVGDEPITLNKAMDYRIVNHQILLICRHDKTLNIPYVTLSLNVYNVKNNVEHKLIFPDLLQIKSVEFFDAAFGKFYVVVTDQNDLPCLWSTPKSDYHLTRKTCWRNTPPFQIFDHNIFLNKQMNEILFVNHAQYKCHITYISINDGRSWQEVKLVQESESAILPNLGLNWEHYQSNVVPDNLKFMNIHAVKSNENKYFVTFDGGFSWKLIPRSGRSAIALNHDTVILSIDINSKEITFSRDHGDSWLSFPVFTHVPDILHVGRLDDTSLKAIIVYKSKDRKLCFKILDFSRMFDSLCKKNDYVPRNIPTDGGLCYLGYRIHYHSRPSKTYCKDLSVKHTYEQTSKCSCRLLDFQCAYNYRSDIDLCVQDEHSCTQEDPVKCDSPSLNKAIGKKYIMPFDNQCDLKMVESIQSLITRPEYCTANDLKDYILVFEKTAINLMYLESGGSHFVGADLSQVSINPNVNIGSLMVIDFYEKLIYTFVDSAIISYNLNTRVAPRILYQINDKIVSMSFDPVSRSLFYLTDKNQLYVVSLLTNYGMLLTNHVTSFSYSPHDHIISYAKGKRFCYFNWIFHVRCIAFLHNITQSLFDLDSLKVFILTTTRQLFIQRVNLVENSLVNLFNIDDVDNFVVHLNNLYFLSSGRLFHRELDIKKRNHLLHTNTNFIYLVSHRETWTAFYQQCNNLQCDFMCAPAANDQVICICPMSSTLKNRIHCSCIGDLQECLNPYCMGFTCRNGQCKASDVRCNGKDECSDASDEKDCQLSCGIGMHRCMTECIPSDQPCDDQSQDINKESKLVPNIGIETEFINHIDKKSEFPFTIHNLSSVVNGAEEDSAFIQQAEINTVSIVSSNTQIDTIKFLLIGLITVFGVGIIFAVFWIFIYPWVRNTGFMMSLKKAQSVYEPSAKSIPLNKEPLRT